MLTARGLVGWVALVALAFVSLVHANRTPSLVIVTAHYREDLGWLKQSTWPVVVCDKPGSAPMPFDADPQCSLKRNVGREASAFLQYIVTHYDALPLHVAFIHGHETAWHQKLPFRMLDAIDRAHRSNVDYVNLNNVQHSKVISQEALEAVEDHAPWLEVGQAPHALLEQHWDRVFRPVLHAPFPEHLRFMCCAQFVVSSLAIRRHPRDAYQRLLDFVTDESIGTDWDRAVAVEFVWHMLLGGQTGDMCQGVPRDQCTPQHHLDTHFAPVATPPPPGL